MAILCLSKINHEKILDCIACAASKGGARKVQVFLDMPPKC